MRNRTLLLFLAGAVLAGDGEPILSTFSIVARDEDTGDFGVAVQSKYFNVGSVCPWAKAEVGAITTQAAANYSYGPEGLRLLDQGLTAQQALEKLTGADEGRDRRQLAIIDAKGNVAAWTGAKCNPWAGHRKGPNYSVQGNILAGEDVVKGMERGFLETKGTFAERLVAALQAGQDAGGDARGKQSAALIIVRKNSVFGSDRLVDLRVDDNPEPIRELARLAAHYQLMQTTLDALRTAQKDLAAAIIKLETGVRQYDADDTAHYALARLHARAGHNDRALAELRRALQLNRGLWKMAAADVDFKTLRETPEFARLAP